MPKSLKDWKKESVEFDYKNNHFSVVIGDSLILKDLSVDEIKERLNELPARQAYWKAFEVTIDDELDLAEEAYDTWFQGKYMKIDQADPKKTESWKKSKVVVEYSQEHHKQRKEVHELRLIKSKVNVILTGYNTQIWTLREIAKLTHAEISGLGAGSITGRPSGSLADL